MKIYRVMRGYIHEGCFPELHCFSYDVARRYLKNIVRKENKGIKGKYRFRKLRGFTDMYENKWRHTIYIDDCIVH